MKKNKQYFGTGEMVTKELRRFKRVYRLQIMFDFFNGGVVLTILLALSAILYKIKDNTVNIPLWIFMILPFFSALLSLLKPVKITEFASMIDKKLGLKERLITSFHFLDKKETYTTLLFHDTLNRMKGFEPRFLFPLKWPRTTLLFTVLSCMLLFYNYYNVIKVESSGILHISQDIKIVMQKEGTQLKKLADKLEKNSSFTEPREKIFIQNLENLGDKLQSENINKRDALLMLTDLSLSIKSRYKEKTGSSDASNLDDKYSEPLEERFITAKEDTVKEVLNSLRLAKRHIAEADLEANKEHTRQASGEGSSTKSLSQGESTSGVSGETEHLDSVGKSSVTESGLSRGGKISGLKDETDLSKNLEFPPKGIILKYSDSVIPLESLPKKYHRITIKYFDAISGSKYKLKLKDTRVRDKKPLILEPLKG